MLVGSRGAAGVETLKNLVLPGVGSFIVIDESNPYPLSTTPVEESTVPSSNFFMPLPSPSTDGETYSSVVASTIGELNPDVASSHYSVPPPTSLLSFISSGPSSSAASPSLHSVITSLPSYPPSTTPTSNGALGTILLLSNDLTPEEDSALSELAVSLMLPLMMVRTYGHIGTVRIQSSSSYFPIMDPRPANPRWDLRLSSDFPELMDYANSIISSMSSMDDQQHAHVPYPLLLIRGLKEWNREMPKTFAEKEEFKAMVKSWSRNFNDELNFQEAVREAYVAYVPSGTVPDEVKEIFDTLPELSAPLKRTSSQFVILLSALRNYAAANNNAVPLNGAIPDMTASSKAYIDLQTVYHTKATSDLKAFTTMVHAALSEAGLPASYIPDATISTFVKNIPYLQVTASTPYHVAASGPPAEEVKEEIQSSLWDPYEEFVHTPIIWFVGLRACEIYFRQTGSWPSDDSAKLEGIMKIVWESYGVEVSNDESAENQITDKILRDISAELCRYNHAEVHNISAVIGGVAGQEAVKIITRQYVPINNTYVYNGIVGVGGVCRG